MFLIFAMVVVLASPAVALIVQEKPGGGDVALVVASPWGQDIAALLNGAGMPAIYPQRAPLGAFVVLASDDSVELLMAHGAWMVLRGDRLLDLC
ncbi:MAG: hypothetical protein AAFN76_11940 [Pseudomonadota bacterium]